jgi:hypothetical protein
LAAPNWRLTVSDNGIGQAGSLAALFWSRFRALVRTQNASLEPFAYFGEGLTSLFLFREFFGRRLAIHRRRA